jgi:Arc/MetJ-type ribon-helix-helix transcriptional regulator
MPEEMMRISVRLPVADLRRIRGNRSAFVREAVAEKLKREEERWRPKTAVGKKLLKLRQQFIAGDGKLLNAEELARELRSRRGGVS